MKLRWPQPLRAIAALLLLLASVPAISLAADRQANVHSHQFHTSDGARLHYFEARPYGRRPPKQAIILIPGWSMPASIWSEQMRELGQRWRVLALDPRGQGRSSVPRSGFHFDRRADDIHEFLKRFPRSIVVGWSLGALETLHAMHRHGDRLIAGLVIVDSSIGEGSPSGPGGFADALRNDRKAVLENFIRSLFAAPPAEATVARLLDQALRIPLEASISLFPGNGPREQWRASVHAFSRPLAYVITPAFSEQAEALLLARPQSMIEIFPEARHALFVDEPHRFARIVESVAARSWAYVPPRGPGANPSSRQPPVP